MASGRRLAGMLPRLVARPGRAAAACNAAGLLGTALVGTALIHLLAYHLPAGAPQDGQWGTAALALLLHCPLLGPLGVILAIAVLAPLLAFHELRRLKRLHAALARRIAQSKVPLPPACVVPRSRRRLVGFAAALLVLQALLGTLAGLLCPMQMTMVMGGRLMSMPLAPTPSLGLLHVLVAGLLALLLWRIERRLTRLRAHIAQQLRLLFSRQPGGAVRLPISSSVRLPLGWYGLTLFARPPPSFVLNRAAVCL